MEVLSEEHGKLFSIDGEVGNVCKAEEGVIDTGGGEDLEKHQKRPSRECED